MGDEAWQTRREGIFGTADWRDRSYRKEKQTTLFDESEDQLVRDASEQAIVRFIEERLVFFVLLRGTVAVKIAEHILKE